MTEAVENEGRKVRLIMNQKKCKVMVSNAWEDSEEIKIGGSTVGIIEDFCYLGSYMSNNGTSKCDKGWYHEHKACNISETVQDRTLVCH